MGDSEANQVIIVKNCKIVTGTKDIFWKMGNQETKEEWWSSETFM